MTPVITLVALVFVPVVILLVLRINAALVFLSLCLGDVLVQFVAADASDFMTLLASSPATAQVHPTHMILKLALLLLPAALTAVFMVRTVRGRGRLLLNALPATGVGLLGGLLVVPLLPPGLSHDIVHTTLWSDVQRTQDLIVGASAIVCLLVLWLQRPKTGGGESKHKSGKHKE